MKCVEVQPSRVKMTVLKTISYVFAPIKPTIIEELGEKKDAF